ncbi:hypothetical protein DFAR_3740026 [Desulfarculales bacterium]
MSNNLPREPPDQAERIAPSNPSMPYRGHLAPLSTRARLLSYIIKGWHQAPTRVCPAAKELDT